MAFNRGPGGSQSGSSEIEDTPVTIAQGGTSATTAVQARANLGIGTMGTQPSNSVSITGGTITGITPLPVASGGTGASGQAEARTNLGIASAATQATEYFATAAQGALADTAVQPADIGTAAAEDVGYFATAAQGALADSAVQPGDLATVATSGDYDDLTNKPSIPVNLDDLGDVVITTPSNNQVLSYNGTNWVNANAGSGSGTVTSVDMTVPTGLSVSGNPITTSGTLAVAYASGYAIPTTAKQGDWDTAYGWGDHSTEGYLTTETDPVFSASTAAGIDSTDVSNWDTAYGWGNHASAGYAADNAVVKLTGDQTVSGTKTFSSTISGSITGNAGTVTNGVVTTGSYADPSWITSLSETKVLPSQTSQSGKYLTTNGTATSWATLPPGGQYLGTATTKAIMYNAKSIAENITIDGTYNALSAGPITIDSSYTVTVSSGATWTIV